MAGPLAVSTGAMLLGPLDCRAWQGGDTCWGGGDAQRGQTQCSLRPLQEEKPPGPLVFSGHERKPALILNKIRRKKNELSGSKIPLVTTSLQL